MKTCPWCKLEPVYDPDVDTYFCDTKDCPIQGLMMSKKDWEDRDE